MTEPIDSWLDRAETLVQKLEAQNVSKNMLGDAYSVLTQSHAINFEDWLLRYGRLSQDHFATGVTSAKQRQTFVTICKNLTPPPENQRAWGYIIGWAQRLHSGKDVPSDNPIRQGGGKRGHRAQTAKPLKPKLREKREGDDDLIAQLMKKMESKNED